MTSRFKFLELGLSRRDFLTTSASLAAGFSAANFFIPKASAGQDKMTKELQIMTWGGSFGDGVRQAIVEPFEKEYGVKVTVGVLGANAEMLAKLRAATMGGAPSDIDVLWLNLAHSYIAITQGLVEPLRPDNIPSYSSIIDPFNKLKNPVPWDPGKEIHGVPAEYVPGGIAYNSKRIQGKLDSVGELWNPAYEGKLGIFSQTIWQMVNAAVLVGQDPNNFTDLDEIWAKLRQQRKLVKRYFSGMAEGQEMFRNETIHISSFGGGRALALQREGHPIEYYQPKEGYLVDADLLIIGKGSKNRYTAEKFIEFTLRPDIATASTEAIGYPHTSKNAQPTEIIRNLPDYDPTGELKGVILPDPPYWDAHMSAWTEKLRQTMAGG